MIRYTIEPQCSKCGSIETTMIYSKWAPMSDLYPGDFLNVTCECCKYVFKMQTRDWEEKDNGK